MREKEELLCKRIEGLAEKSIVLAFSGGVDSSLILKLSSDFCRKKNTKVYAVMFETKLHPMGDKECAAEVAEQLQADFQIIEVNEFENKEILKNPENRCYLCKKYMFDKLVTFAKEKNVETIIDGTNASDLEVYRPGIKALKELNVISPLAEAGFTKAEVREMAEKLGISVSKRPSAPCLATRLPYGDSIDFELLNRVDKGEMYLKELGFSDVRLRFHKDIVRIEVKQSEFEKMLKLYPLIIEKLKELNFIYITLDLEGFRSGSMDVYIK